MIKEIFDYDICEFSLKKYVTRTKDASLEKHSLHELISDQTTNHCQIHFLIFILPQFLERKKNRASIIWAPALVIPKFNGQVNLVGNIWR